MQLPPGAKITLKAKDYEEKYAQSKKLYIALAFDVFDDKIKSISFKEDAVKHLFKDWEYIQARIQQAQNLFLFLDYDGTLTPIVSRPELALCPPEVKRHLEELRDLPWVSLAIISGRSLEDLRRKVGVSGIIYVGNHGLEIEHPDGRHQETLPSARTREVKRITQNLQNSLREIPGIIFEEKGPVLSVHYRNVPREFSEQIRHVIEEEPQLWKGRWKMVLLK